MNSYRSNSLNQFWFISVVIHLIGSLFVSIFLQEYWGLLLLNSIFWIYCGYANRSKKLGIFLSALAWSLNLYLLTRMPLSLAGSLLLNMIFFTYVFYLHFGSFSLLAMENHIRKIPLKTLLMILVLTILFLVIGSYVNAVSMLFSHNYAQDALLNVKDHFLEAILALAVLPALVEEIGFRGFIFQRLGNSWKAVFISAALFALRHMNLNQMCYAFVMGILLAMVYRITDNLSVSIGIHFLFNLYSVLTSVWEDSALVQAIWKINIGGYSPWNASLRDEAGNVMAMSVIWGAVIAILALLLVFFLFRFLNQEERQEAVGKEPAWKADYLFCLGCFICILSGFFIK